MNRPDVGSDPVDPEWPPKWLDEVGLDPKDAVIDGVEGGGPKPKKRQGSPTKRAARPTSRKASGERSQRNQTTPKVAGRSDPRAGRKVAGRSDPRAGRSDPTDRMLRSFVAAVRSGSLTAAGRELGVGQSAVSHAMKDLENAAGGIRLLERSRLGVRPTPAGQVLFDEIGPLFDRIDTAVRSIRDVG